MIISEISLLFTHMHTHTHTHVYAHTSIHQASPLSHTTSSSSFVHPQLAQLSEHPRQSFIYTPPESGRQPLGIPPPQSRPRDQERRPGENGGVPRGLGQPSTEGPKMVREREFIHATRMDELQNYSHVKVASLAVVLVPRKLK